MSTTENTKEVTKTRGRPVTNLDGVYDVKAYAKKFRDKAPKFHCDSCEKDYSYFSKDRHLKTQKHKDILTLPPKL